MTYTAGSLFSGIGGIDYAFAACGFDIRFQVEIDPFCRQVLEKHRPAYWRNAVIHEDVKHVGRSNLEAVDVLFGGFPCQDISNAGKRAGIEPGTRSGLWFEFARIIGDLRPRVVFLENVAAILSLGGTVVTGGLAEMGYDAFWMPLRAADVGAPHSRERWFCIAWNVSDATGTGLEGGRREQADRHPPRITPLVDPCRPRLEGQRSGTRYSGSAQSLRARAGQHDGQKGLSESRLGRHPYGLSRRLEQHQFPAFVGEQPHWNEPPRTALRKTAHWKDRVKALGNAVVPQAVYPFALAIRTWLEAADAAERAA